MRPCDCKDEQDTKKLECNGIMHNDESLVVTPNCVTLTLGHTTVTMSMRRFKQFAEWYLEDQKESKKPPCPRCHARNVGISLHGYLCFSCDHTWK